MEKDQSPPPGGATADPVRALVERLVAERRVELATVSRAIGRNHAYLSQFLSRGVPRHLPERAREALARYFNISADALRPPEERGRAPPRSPEAGLDPGLLDRANKVARRLIGDGDHAEDNRLRVEVTSSVYTLLERDRAGLRIIDDEPTLRILELLIQRLRSRN
jgi:hypothetical protein